MKRHLATLALRLLLMFIMQRLTHQIQNIKRFENQKYITGFQNKFAK